MERRRLAWMVGPNPPFHHPVFVLTHHSRPSIEMEGGTTFHFVTDGIHSALEQAFDAAGGQDVRVGGGVRTVQQYLSADLVDHMHIVIVPVFFGAGERLFDSTALVERYECVDLVGGTAAVAHLRVVRRGE
jgi:dihydrofolate reductase